MVDRRRSSDLLAVVLLLSACGQSGAPSTEPSASVAPSAAPPSSVAPAPSSAATVSAAPSASPAPSDDLPPIVDIATTDALAIDGGPNIDWTVVVDGRAWIAGPGKGFGIFGQTGEMDATVEVVGGCQALDVADGAVWTTMCGPNGVARIDTTTLEVKEALFPKEIIPDSEASIGVGEGAAWLVAGAVADTLLKIDTTSLEIVGRYPIPAGGAGVRAAYGGVWITRPYNNELLHVDPATGTVVATIPVGPGPRFLAVGEGSVWVMNQTDGTVSRVDPATDAVLATIDVGAQIFGGDISVGGGSVWVRGGPEMLARIDPTTNLVTQRWGPEVGSGSAAGDADAVWITAHDVGTIWRLPLE